MNKFIRDIKTRIAVIVSSFLSVLGAGSGSATAVCQTTCASGSAIPFFLGFTLSATPLAFIEDYQIPLWWISLTMFAALFILYMQKLLYSKNDKAFLFLNAGLLIIGFPYFKDRLTLTPWIGLLFIIFGLYIFIASKRFVIQWS